MIYIIGAGAIGRALAVFLTKAGKEVILLRASIATVTLTQENQEVKLADGTIASATLTLQALDDLKDKEGIVLVTAKSYGNQVIAGKLAAIGFNGPVVLLQNGLNIERPFLDLGLKQLHRCVLMVTSQFAADQTLRYRPVDACPVGPVAGGHDEALKALLAELDNQWFRFRETENIMQMTWKKVITNCVFNSVCPLLDTHNGIFHHHQGAMAIARRIIAECTAVARCYGIGLEPAEVEQTLLSISRSADGQFISTLQDIRQKRKTEIETLNLEIVALAEKLGMGQMVQETRLLGELTAIKSELNR